MKIAFAALALSLAVAPAFVQKSCEELKSEIVAKLDAKGVKSYQLEIVATADVKDQTVVGSCEFGAKKITYKKNAKPEHAEETPAVPPPGHFSLNWRRLPPMLSAPAASGDPRPNLRLLPPLLPPSTTLISDVRQA